MSVLVGASPRRRATDRVLRTLLALATVVALVPLVLILYYLLDRGLGAWSVDFFTKDPTGSFLGDQGGVRSAILGTLEIVALASIVAIPFGWAVALYLVEFGRGRFANLVRYLVDVMTGVPSIVFGLFVYVTLVVGKLGGSGFAAWKGSAALALLMLPVVTRSAEVVLQLVPTSLQDVSLEYAANSVTAMIGPSGSGKSTIVRCINRMHEEIPGARADGRILLEGQDVLGADVVAVRRAVGMVFQTPNPFPTMSIFDNVAAGLRLDRVKGAELHERVERSLRRADLWDEVEERLSAPAIRLSGGQQQRLCIARTIAVEPAVILIAELKESFTIVIVTHNLQQAARVADTTAFVLAGELVEHAPTTTMFTTPSDPRTEQYVTGKFG